MFHSKQFTDSQIQICNRPETESVCYLGQCNISFDVYPIFLVLPVVRDDSKEARRWVQCFKTRNWSKNHWPGGSSFPQTQSKNESFSSNQTKILDFFHIDNFRIISTTTVWGLQWLLNISYRPMKAAITAWHTASNVFARSNRLYCDPSQASCWKFYRLVFYRPRRDIDWIWSLRLLRIYVHQRHIK